jgi:hypothetical protein
MDSCNPRLSLRKRQSSVVSFLVLLDAVLILAAYMASLLLVGETGLSGFRVWVLAIIAVPFVASTAIVGGYKRRVTIESPASSARTSRDETACRLDCHHVLSLKRPT